MTSTPILHMQGMSKRFGSTVALADVDLSLFPGEIHALIGENGAGKSTLMKLLSGALTSDQGHMHLAGQPYRPSQPVDALRQGVAIVYQEQALSPHLSVEANLLLGLEQTRWGFLRRGENRQRAAQALAQLEHPEIQLDVPVHTLSPAAQQLLEIARALLVDARVLVLDEPTSSLTKADAQRLFALMRRLRERGVAIVYISHFLEEVEQIADRYTVLRDGRSVSTGLLRDTSRAELIAQMVGRSLTEQYPKVPHSPGEVLLEVKDLAGVKLPRSASFTLRRGEILGIAGLVGSGRSELLRALFGLEPIRQGRVTVKQYSGLATARGRIQQGVGLLSENRKEEGLALSQSVADNMTYSWLAPYRRLGWLDLGRRAQACADWLAKLRVRYRTTEQPVGELSGGNQQKVALGRLLHQQADLLLLDEPTRGVDIGSKAEIYHLIGTQAAAGKAVLVVSSYLPELFGICDRLAVMSRGQLSPARPCTEWTELEVMAFATGASS